MPNCLQRVTLGLQPDSFVKLRDLNKKKMDEVGIQIVQEKKAGIIAEMGGQAAQIDKKSVGGKDLISLLLQANLAVDASHRLSDEEVLAQIPTFLVAGKSFTRPFAR